MRACVCISVYVYIFDCTCVFCMSVLIYVLDMFCMRVIAGDARARVCMCVHACMCVTAGDARARLRQAWMCIGNTRNDWVDWLLCQFLYILYYANILCQLLSTSILYQVLTLLTSFYDRCAICCYIATMLRTLRYLMSRC